MVERTLGPGIKDSRRQLVQRSVEQLLDSANIKRFMAQRPGYGAAITQQLSRWSRELDTTLKHQPMPAANRRELSLFQSSQQQPADEFLDNIDALLLQLRGHSAFYEQARELLRGETADHPAQLQAEFIRRWQQHLEVEVLAQQLELVEQEREKLFSDLSQRMETCDQLEEVMAEADPNRMGRLWDMASTRLHQQQLRQLGKFSRALRKNRGLKEIADQLGRMARTTVSQRQEDYRVTTLRPRRSQQQHALEDIVGVHLKNDINRMLSVESIYLAYPELELIFYKHLIEQRLLNYRMSGFQTQPQRVEETRSRSRMEQHEPGPFLVCVDTSGSMGGYPELCAKALCLGLMQYAMSDQRGCYVMIFSTEVTCFELGAAHGLSEVLDFLSYSFNGGTDLQPCIQQAVDLMQDARYASADLVVISDFIAQRLPKALRQQVEEQKTRRNRFHAVSLSRYGNPALMNIFDHLWSFDTSLYGRVLTKLR